MMTFLKDEAQKHFWLGMTAVLAAASLLAIALWYLNGCQMKRAALRHDECIVSSLLAQGVEESVIAKALTDEEAAAAGTNLLLRMGIGRDTGIFFMPGIREVQKGTGILLTGLMAFLWISLLSLTGLFFSARERLCRRAFEITDQFMKGNFSEHLPRMDEGGLSRLFGKIDSLASALSAESQKALEAKNFLKEMISDISHQLKTPLSALTVYNEIIASDPESRETVLAFTDKTGAALRRMETLIQTMLKISRLDAGAVVFEKQPWLLTDVVSRAVSELLVRAQREHKEIRLTGPDNVMADCDLQWTGEAIGNLVKNALDCTEEGALILISWEACPGSARISVSDNGSGIQEKDIYHIFKRFYRAGEKRSGPGAGLGLPLARSVAEGQGGTLSVQSRPGEGSVFTMTLPE